MKKQPCKATIQEVCQKIVHETSASQRLLVAMAGAPGSGKSRCAENLQQLFNDRHGIKAEILAMDGYHYDDAILNARGLRHRKGSPETFDVAGLCNMLHRLHDNTEDEIYIPVFDRHLEISRAGAGVISLESNIIIVEGNYVLVNKGPWASLAPLFHKTIMIQTSEKELRRRLTHRWISHGIPEHEIALKLEYNDLPNGRFVYAHSYTADFSIENERFP